MAPAFTIGFMVRSCVQLDRHHRLNGSPVAFTPIFFYGLLLPTAWQTSANTNGFDTLWIENSCAVPHRKGATLDPDYTHAEQFARRARQSPVCVRDLPFVEDW